MEIAADEINDPVETKIRKIATSIYGADDIILEKMARLKLKEINNMGYQNYPVCIAKTQYSFTDTAEDIHRYKDFVITVDDLIINSGAGFLVAVCGEMMRMPGLPEKPAALNFV